MLNPYGHGARPEETGRSVDKVAHKPLDQAHRPVSGAIRSTATPRPARSAEDQAALQREADAVARVARYDDYYDHARRALQDGGEAAIPELREIARLHSLAVGKSDPQAARQFDAGINREIAAYRAQATSHQANAGVNAGANAGAKGGLESSQAKIGLGDPGAYNPARYQKRKDEDYPTAQARIAGAIAQDQEAAEKRRFAEGSETYAAVKEKAGVTITRAPDAEPVLDFGDGVRLEGLDTTGTKRLAEAMAQDPVIADDIRKVLSGDLSVEDIEDRLAELGAFDKTSLGPRRRSRNQGAIDRELALLDVVEGQASGASKADMAETLVNAYAPDGAEDLALARDLLLDMLPLIGEVRSAQDAVTDFTAMTKAIEAGNWKLAGQNGLFAVLAVAGAAPGVGKVAKLARTALVRGLRTTAGGRKLVAGYRLQRGLIQAKMESVAGWKNSFPTASPQSVFGATLETLPKDLRSHIEGAWPYIVGEAGERNMRQSLKDVGATQIDDIADRRFEIDGKGRNYDAVVRQDLKTKFGMFLLPAENGDAWKGLEMKINQSKHGRQAPLDATVNDKTLKAKQVTKKGDGRPTLEVEEVVHFRDRLDQIPIEILEEALRDVLKNGRNNGWTNERIQGLVSHVRHFHAESSASSPISVGMMLAGIAGMGLDATATPNEI